MVSLKSGILGFFVDSDAVLMLRLINPSDLFTFTSAYAMINLLRSVRLGMRQLLHSQGARVLGYTLSQ